MKLNETILFHGISAEECGRMLQCLGARSAGFQAGEIIYSLGENETRMGVISCGTAAIERIDYSGNRSILDRLEERDIFGESEAFAPTYGDGAFLIAETDCQVVFIPRDRIARPCAKSCDCHSIMLTNLLGMLSNKTNRLGKRVEVLSCRTTREKLLRYLTMESYRAGSREFSLPFSVSALADYLCIDRSAMMREIAAMKRDGLLESEKRCFRLLQGHPAD